MTTNNLSPQQLQELVHHVVAICAILELPVKVAHAPTIVYPSLTKAQLAAVAHTTTRTFNRWIKPYQEALYEMGITPKCKILHPKAVKFLCERLEIDISSLQDKNADDTCRTKF